MWLVSHCNTPKPRLWFGFTTLIPPPILNLKNTVSIGSVAALILATKENGCRSIDL